MGDSMAVRVTRGMVTTPHPTAAQAGLEILRAGGTAVDAAVAAAFTLAVVTPASTGIAGYGGCLTMYLADPARVVTLAFSCRAPAAAREDMFAVHEDGHGGFTVDNEANATGPLAVDVPGTVAGLTLAQERFGTLPLADVMQPANAAARHGFAVDAWTVLKITETLVPRASRFPETLRWFSRDGRPPRPGETLANPDLAAVLEVIAQKGAAAFYRGEIAHAIVDTVQRAGGILTLDDLAAYTAQEVAPARASYRGMEAFTPPLPAGGLTVLQMLRVLEGLDIPRSSDADRVHLLVEVAKACWRERLTRYGDPACVSIDQDAALSQPLVGTLRGEVEAGLRSPRGGTVVAPDPLLTGTVHVCTADCRGNVVSLTFTHGGSFGSLVTVPGTGLVLSHGLSRFDPRPGRPNSIGPRKQPLHNMSPTLVLSNGRPLLAIGAAGGRTVQSNIFHSLVRLIDLGDAPEAAVAAVRFHVETAEPVLIEEGGEALAGDLAQRGHQVQLRPRFGAVQAIHIGPEPDLVTGVGDPRRAGTVLWV